MSFFSLDIAAVICAGVKVSVRRKFRWMESRNRAVWTDQRMMAADGMRRGVEGTPRVSCSQAYEGDICSRGLTGIKPRVPNLTT